MKSHYELIVIGAGPSGMSAATMAASHDVSVLVVDEQSSPGGQIYRSVQNPPTTVASYLGKDYWRGKNLAHEFINSQVSYIRNAKVWYINKDRELGVIVDGVNRVLTAEKILIATGAQERPMPIPGWQLPGVMSAGAGQILLKSAATVPSDGVVLAGNGPLLLLLAVQYLKAGVRIQALLDTTPKGRASRVLVPFVKALPAFEYLIKGISLIARLKLARVPLFKGVSELRAVGEQQLTAVSFSSDSWFAKKHHKLDTRLLLLHQGVIPRINLPLAADCEIEWSSQQLCWQVSVDDWGQSSVPGLFVGGDGARIDGARAAELQGAVIALQIAYSLGRIDVQQRNRGARVLRRSLRRHTSVRSMLDIFYAPNDEYLLPPDDTVVCRCEEVTAGKIREIARLGCTGPNQTKAFTRCGMGPCQGAQCGTTVAALIAAEHRLSMAEVGLYQERPPIKPITLGELAGLKPAIEPVEG